MKLTTCLILFAFLQVGAKGVAQGISLDENSVSLGRVLKKIDHQSGYTFLYENKVLKKASPVTLKVSDASLDQALQLCFKGQPLTYKIFDRTVVIKEKPVQNVQEDEDGFTVIPLAEIVTGMVSNSKGEPLVGVSIVVKGTKIGTYTDENGSYSVEAPEDGMLVFSYIGYTSREIQLNGRRTVDIVLQENVSELDQIVVVGYGEQKKSTLTGAVETIDSKTFEDRAVTNVGLALQGQTPGLVVTRSSPRPGNEGLAFKIRGATSVNGSDPLIVVDGVPVLNKYSFQNLNSDDIESISVLKDGAAAIYGSRASNGVILVTTKRGKGKVRVNFSSNLRFNTNGITGYSPDMQEYATMWIEANKEETTPNWWVWGEENLRKMQQGVEGAYDLYDMDFYIFNANRIKEMFSTRYSYQHNLSVSGSTDKSGYRLSFEFADNQGNLATAFDGQKQYNARFNYDYNFSKRLRFETNLSIINANTSEPSVGLDNTLYGFDMPFYPAKNPFGQWFATFNGVDGGATRNAAAMTSDGGRNNQNSLTGRVDVKGTYKIIDGLSLEGMASLQNERFNQERYVLKVPVYNWYGDQTGIGNGTDGTNNIYYTYAWQGLYQYYSGLLKYDKQFNGVHNVTAMAGINAEKNNSQSVSANRVGFDDQGVYDINLASTTTQTNSGGKSLNGRYSYLGRITYNYAEKYLVELLGRRDGNSRFAPGFKFKNFGTVLAGWVFTKEKFMERFSSVIDFGKLRGSYGTTGNEASGLGAFDYLSTINIGTVILGEPAAQNQSASLNNNGLISFTRTWEKVLQKNIGVDLGFWESRLTLSFDAYQKDNIGMLINVNYPSVLGGSAPKTNSGKFSTKGWEAVIGWRETKKDFSYNISLNMGDSYTLVTDVEGADNYNAGRNGIVNGYPWQPWFVYKTDGYFKNQKDVDDYYAQYGSSTDLAALPQNNESVALRPGDVKKVDVANTKNITGIGNDESSLWYAGDGTPHYTFGANLGGAWRGIEINAFFQGQLDQLIMRQGPMAYPYYALYNNQNPSFLGKTWTENNAEAIFPRLTVNTTRAKWNYVNNDFMLQNNRYVRLKTLIIGYSLPQSLTRKIKLERVKFYFSGNDLWEATSIKDGFDPEMGEATVDNKNGYPFARTWSFGINIGF